MAQSGKDAKSIADAYFAANNFVEAEAKYADIVRQDGTNENVLLNLAIAQFHNNKLDNAKQILEAMQSSKKHRNTALLYLAKCHHAEGNFIEAISFYKNHLRRLGKKATNRNVIIDAIKRCHQGYKMEFREQIAFVENAGEVINSAGDEFAMVQSPNYTERFYFTSIREGNSGGRRNESGYKDIYGYNSSDILRTEYKNGAWKEPLPFNPLINTARHEILADLSSDGSIAYFYRGYNQDQGLFLTDTFSNEKQSDGFSRKWESPINGNQGDRDVFLFNDSIVFFSSDRAGGFGGFDIYYCLKKKEGWTKEVNLGPSINSAFDEVSPFVTFDGRTIYFSSNGRTSMGGFDIFRSTYLDKEAKWNPVENLGEPINSPTDDQGFRISADGLSATFSSSRISGFGGKDIYIAYFKELQESQMQFSSPLTFFMTADPKEEEGTEIVEKEEVVVEEEVVKKVDYLISSLYFQSDDFVRLPANKRNLDRAAELLLIYPQLKLEIAGHTINDGPEEFNIYFSIKRAESVRAYLQSKGVGTDRLLLKGFGSSYPITKPLVGGQPNSLAKKLNQRIHLKFHNTDGVPVNFIFDEPVVAAPLQSVKYRIYKDAVVGLSYKVRVAEVDQMYRNEVLTATEDPQVMVEWGSTNYLYSLGLFKTFFGAKRLRTELINAGFVDAVIMPYIDGVPVPRNEIINFVQEYQDLLNYLQED